MRVVKLWFWVRYLCVCMFWFSIVFVGFRLYFFLFVVAFFGFLLELLVFQVFDFLGIFGILGFELNRGF